MREFDVSVLPCLHDSRLANGPSSVRTTPLVVTYSSQSLSIFAFVLFLVGDVMEDREAASQAKRGGNERPWDAPVESVAWRGPPIITMLGA